MDYTLPTFQIEPSSCRSNDMGEEPSREERFRAAY